MKIFESESARAREREFTTEHRVDEFTVHNRPCALLIANTFPKDSGGEGH